MQLLPLDASPRFAPRSATPLSFPVASAPVPLAWLIEQVLNPCVLPDFEVSRRHAIAQLVLLQASEAIEAISTCLTHWDVATQSQSIWALGELNCQDSHILQQLTQLLSAPQAPLRLLLHTLARLGYKPALPMIQSLLVAATSLSDEPSSEAVDPLVRSAAIAALYRLSPDSSDLRAYLAELTAALRHSDAQRRDAAFADLLLAQASPSLAALSQTVSPVLTRLQALRTLADQGYVNGQVTFVDLEPIFDNLLQAHAQTLYPRAFRDLGALGTAALGTAALGTAAISLTSNHNHAASTVPPKDALEDPLRLSLLQAIHQPHPRHLAEQLAAVIALGNWGNTKALQPLCLLLISAKSEPSYACPWELAYACLMSLHRLGEVEILHRFSDSGDWMLRSKSLSLLNQP
jgi:bilin biosynthesis protein